jgi:hypothetical protein
MLKPEDILDWGIEVVLWFQQFSPEFDLPFKSVTFLGNLEFFLLFMPLIYWCIDRRMGARLPSGHTQGTVVVWGYRVSQHRSGILWIVAGFLCG